MDSITHFLIPLAVTVVLSMLMKSAASAHAVSVGGRSTVGYGIGFKGFAVFSGLLTLALLIGVFFVAPGERIGMLLLAAIFGVPALYLLLEGFGVRVVYSDSGIEAFSPWRRNRSAAWDEISEVSFSPMARWHRIKTTHGYIRLHEMKSGVPSLLQELERRGIRTK